MIEILKSAVPQSDVWPWWSFYVLPIMCVVLLVAAVVRAL